MSYFKTCCFLNIFLLFFLSSCISTRAYWERKDYQPQKGGVLYYNSQPALFDKTAVDQRKQDAQMKMISFCDPEKPNLLSERKAEEVIGQSTSYSSSHNNPSTNYYSRETYKRDGSAQKEKAFVSSPFSYSSGSSRSTNIVRKRVYITFECR